jgi:hypothetical protein
MNLSSCGGFAACRGLIPSSDADFQNALRWAAEIWKHLIPSPPELAGLPGFFFRLACLPRIHAVWAVSRNRRTSHEFVQDQVQTHITSKQHAPHPHHTALHLLSVQHPSLLISCLPSWRLDNLSLSAQLSSSVGQHYNHTPAHTSMDALCSPQNNAPLPSHFFRTAPPSFKRGLTPHAQHVMRSLLAPLVSRVVY